MNWSTRFGPRLMSSAGNTRGLIEARPVSRPPSRHPSCLPRGIPAASLKLDRGLGRIVGLERLPRGIPAASLKLNAERLGLPLWHRLPRGIPAASLKPVTPEPSRQPRASGLPRGIPAASLKPSRGRHAHRDSVAASSAGNTRGLIEARCPPTRPAACRRVFRGEYPRPH